VPARLSPVCLAPRLVLAASCFLWAGHAAQTWEAGLEQPAFYVRKTASPLRREKQLLSAALLRQRACLLSVFMPLSLHAFMANRNISLYVLLPSFCPLAISISPSGGRLPARDGNARFADLLFAACGAVLPAGSRGYLCLRTVILYGDVVSHHILHPVARMPLVGLRWKRVPWLPRLPLRHIRIVKNYHILPGCGRVGEHVLAVRGAVKQTIRQAGWHVAASPALAYQRESLSIRRAATPRPSFCWKANEPPSGLLPVYADRWP